jgi:hypothetical protein
MTAITAQAKLATQNTPQASPKTHARIIGVLYLLIFFLGPFAFFMGRTSVFVPGDASASVTNLLASESMFRLGMVAETLIVLIEIVVSAMLYTLLKPVSKSLALASAFARFAQANLQAVNLLTAVPALMLLGNNYLVAFTPEQVSALTLLFMDANAFVILMWGLLFGFHLLLLGSLVYRSGFLPKVLGILLMIGAVGYLLQSYGHLVAPQFDAVLANVVIALSVPGELAFTIWLLWKGVNVSKWQQRTASASLTN